MYIHFYQCFGEVVISTKEDLRGFSYKSKSILGGFGMRSIRKFYKFSGISLL